MSPAEAVALPVGSVLVEAGTDRRKSVDDRVHCVVTAEGLKHFQYGWYTRKFDCDRARAGVGVAFKAHANTQLIPLGIPPIDLS